MKHKWLLIPALLVALVGGVAAALTAAPSQNSGPVAAMPLIFSTYPEGGHAHVSVDSVRKDGRPRILAASPGGTLTLTGLLGSQKTQETVSVARFRISCWVSNNISYTPYQRVVLPPHLDPTVHPETLPVTGTMTVPPCTSTARTPDGAYSGSICIVVGAREGGDLGATCEKFLITDGVLPGPELPAVGAAGLVPLWRAVTEAELKSLEEKGAYSLTRGLEGKYFFPTREQAENFKRLAEERGWGTYVVTEAQIEARYLAKAESVAAAGEGPAYFLRARFMNLVKLIRIIR
ncbi:hypothetical protein [Nonomuraea sp. SYSU D8015]|uniref:hypothetical protein n=1 Tax=Nonomuraea sp. SYSU D8015 TaxID=2593644 RepID=UPI0016613A93|nr:hypothetical protein [Nonomuraea sp. SYSU D8015]